LWSQLPLNQVVVQAGPLWASAGRFAITIEGKSSHGAMPHEGVDATLVASHVVVALQSIVARNLDPVQTAVVTVGQFESGTAWNIVSPKATLTGTIRSFDDSVHQLLVRRINEIAEGVCAALGASARVEITGHVPTTFNSEAGARIMQQVAEQIVAPEQIAQITPMMVGEDMAEFLIRAPGCFVLIGAADPAQPLPGAHHNARFDFDERMMPTGVALLAGAAVKYLEDATNID
jgi:amidohydrolase